MRRGDRPLTDRASGDELGRRLAAHLDARVRGRCAAGLAVTRGDPPRPAVAWVPASEAREPACLAYSITKTVTAALVLLLAAEGRLALDDPLSRWFPGIDRAARITVRRLLHHTAGVPDYGGLAAYHDAVREAPGAPWSFAEFGAHTWARGLLFEPGAGWAYSNPGYMLLVRIVEQVSGLSHAELVEARIARPLGLARTEIARSTADLTGLAPALSRRLGADGAARDVREVYHPGWVSHGVMISTPSEIACLVHALGCGRLLPADAVREVTRLVPVPDAPPRWRRPSYGLGIMADPGSPFGPVWGHSGAGPGYSASVFHAPSQAGGPATVAAMCATEEALDAEDLVFEVLGML